jgi:hypothetical protein
MSLISISARSIRDIDPHGTERISIDLEMTDAQIFEAIDELLDAKTPTQRAAWLEQLNEQEAEARS